MEKHRKRVWKRRSSHSIRLDVPDALPPNDSDHPSEHEVPDESNVQCTNCGSLHTRASSALELNLDVIFKGPLYRCRRCKAHFRARSVKTDITKVGSIAAATAVALLFLAIGVANWGRITGFFASLAANRSRQERVQAVKKARNGDFSKEDAEELAYEVVDLYQTADLYHRQFPAMERSYRDVIGGYKELLDNERNGQRGTGNLLIAERLQHVSTAFADTLERGHDMLVKYMETLRRQTDAANRVGAKRLQECAQMKGKPDTSVSQRNCEELALVLATLKTNTEQVELDYTGSEEVFGQTRQEINRIAVANIGQSIMK